MSKPDILQSIVVNAAPHAIFRALTTSDEIVKYYPLQRVESAWVAGGEVRYLGEVDGRPFTDHGVIELLEPPTCYRYRYWSDNHGTERCAGNMVVITYSIEDLGSSARVTVRQENLPSDELRGLMNDVVWPHLLASLKAYMERTAD